MVRLEAGGTDGGLVGPVLDIPALDGPLPTDEHHRHHRGGEQAVLDQPGRGGQPSGQDGRVADGALVIGDHAAVGAEGDVAQCDRGNEPHRGPEAEGEQLERDGAVEGVHRLGRVDDHDETVRRRGHDFFPRVRRAASLYQPAIGRDLVRTVDRHVEMVDVGERFHIKAKFTRRCVGARRGGHTADFELAGGQSREKEGHGRARPEPDRHAVFDQFCGGFCGQLLFVIGSHCHLAPGPVAFL